jgi:Lhr-like helicase
VELIVTNLRRIAEASGTPDIYRAHHGSVSQALREEAECSMKADAGPW